jgi:hypothetical protein
MFVGFEIKQLYLKVFEGFVGGRKNCVGFSSFETVRESSVRFRCLRCYFTKGSSVFRTANNIH